MQISEHPPRDRDWLAFVLPVLGFCVVDCLASVWMSRSASLLNLLAVSGVFWGKWHGATT